MAWLLLLLLMSAAAAAAAAAAVCVVGFVEWDESDPMSRPPATGSMPAKLLPHLHPFAIWKTYTLFKLIFKRSSVQN
jgi:hypothetical protein